MQGIDEAQLCEFAERGYLLLRGVVPRHLIDDASRRRAGRCRGLCRYRDLLTLKVHVWIPAFEDGAQFSVERPHSRL